jgi:hypothetical protein
MLEYKKTNVSVIDIISIVSDETKRPHAVWEILKVKLNRLEKNSLLHESLLIKPHQFIGERQRPTPVVRGIIELLYLIPGNKAYAFRRQFCEIRFMGERLIDNDIR